MYEYRCNVVRVIDGDTVDVDIDLGFGIWRKKERVRLLGIDTPESRTRDEIEKKYGLLAKHFLCKMVDDCQIILKTFKDSEGKFGRILGELWREGDTISINTHLINNFHGVQYKGQSKDEIKKLHLKNRERLSQK
mgnify:FL=1